MARKRKLTGKALDRAKLKETDVVWIGIRATETNLQRLGAFLMFAEYPMEVESVKEMPMPWEDPNDPRFQKPPELQIDYEAVRRSITRHLKAYIEEHGKEKTRALIESFGAKRLSEVPQEQLLALDKALDTALTPAGPGKNA